ncbi:histidine kinase [Phyllobacterium salinisoli]|uniref:histidine kinase n=1 Tax=Phyllobacterium salinisoli TaxID=1899321 RepID=A0A368K6R4_9HYPH|nr:PAS domain-containing sensor histidine kinase [Phyllobacterium salinisoli]RCS23740.1 histidine kinase [Phyllobacterium salinisoli]
MNSPMPTQKPARREASKLRALLRALRNSNVCVLYQTSDLAYLWAENLPDIWVDIWHVGAHDRELMQESTAARLDAAKLLVLETGEPQSVEIAVSHGDQLRWFELSIDCDRDGADTVIGVVTTAVDVTELKRREQVLKTLLREVSHRSKNLLAIIQSIAMQTARFTGTVDDFLFKFRGRVQSLSYSQDLVTDSNWRGAQFRELVRSQMQKYIDVSDPRFTLSGDDPYIFPGAALHIGLAIHELIVNSTSYGALSSGQGTVAISGKLENIGTERMSLLIKWDEKVPGSLRESDLNARFGSAVLERIVPISVNGTSTYNIEDDGVTYSLDVPRSQFDL